MAKDTKGPVARGSATISDQLQERFRASRDARPNAIEEDINKALSKEFDQWLKLDKDESEERPNVGGSLRRNKSRYETTQDPTEAKPKAENAKGFLDGMDSRRVYEQLSMKQKKEIAWLLREEGLV